MNAQFRPRIDDVPTLTDVIGFSDSGAGVSGSVEGVSPAPPPAARGPAAVGVQGLAPSPGDPPLVLMPLAEAEVPVEAWLAVAESQITQQVLSDVQRQVDRMFEYRLRESLGPALARLTDQFIAETRTELATTLRDIVRRAVAQELARLRSR